MMNEPLSSIMAKNVMTASPNDTLKAIKKILFDHNFHHLPVVDGTKLVGIISTHDLLKADILAKDHDVVLVKEFMTTKIAKLNPNEHIGAAAQMFLRQLFQAIPIVDDDNNLQGIVTTYDILKYNFKKSYPDDPFVDID